MSSTTQSQDTPHWPSQDSLRRSAIACKRCRRRKTKCTGDPPHQCSACQDAGVDCLYVESERRVQVTESYLLDLQARAKLADASVRSVQSSDASPPPFSDNDTHDDDDDWWYKGMDTLLLTRSGEHRYVGSASSTYLAQKLNPAPNDNLAWDVHPIYKDPSLLSRPSVPVIPQLPPYNFAKRLYYAQYIYIGTIFSFLQPDTFEERLQQVYRRPHGPSNREECLTLCQILLVLAYGQMYSVNQWSGSEGPPGFAYFKHALWLLPDIHQEGSILFVEVLSLIAPYLQNLNRRDAAFLYIGLALRMAISLGLHQEADDPGIDIIEREHRRRVWWSVYSMDRILSVKSGNPISIHDEDVDVAWPSPIPGVDTNVSPPNVLAAYTKLSRILGRIGEGIYRKRHKSGTNLLASVQTIMNDLSQWMTEVPPELLLDFSALDRPLSREGISTMLHYYQCINMTARPLLFYVCQSRIDALARDEAPLDWREGLSPNVVTVITNSIAGAHASTMIMHAAARQNLFATYGFMDGEHAFSAALTLVMINKAFVYNEQDATAMEIALSVLRIMGEKGNEYIQARYSLLLKLRETIGPPAVSFESITSMPIPAMSYTATPANHSAYSITGSDLTSHVEGVPNLRPTSSFRPDQDISFNFDMNDDPILWEQVSSNIDITMDTDWIENALKQNSHQYSAP